MLTQSEKQQLDELGYLVLPGFIPLPLLGEVMVTKDVLLVAVQGQPVDVNTFTPPEPGEAENAWLVGLIE